MNSEKKEFIDELKNRFEYLRAERRKREADWKEVQRFVAPSVYNWDNPSDKTPKRPKRFTSRPTNFLKTLRSGITGYTVSPNIAWLKLGLENYEVSESYGVKDWLEEVEKLLYAEFKRSNLYPQNSKFIEFAATYGHAVMLIDEQVGDKRLRFTNINPQELFLDINEYDEVDTVFRRYVMTIKNASNFFGEEKLSDNIREDLKDKKKWNNEITIIHAVYKRDEFEKDSQLPAKMQYASVYLEETQDHLIDESGYSEFPYAVFIWDPVNGTPYGESPAIQALDDIKLLNIIDESVIKITQMSAEPAYNVPETMRGETSVIPNGYNYYKKPEEIVSPIDTGKNYPITIDKQKNIEERVKDWFHVDFFLALMNEQAKNVTATFVMELQGEKAAVLSDLIVNINASLTKEIQRSFNILLKQGKIPQPPDELAGSGAGLKVDFIGSLAQAQKKYHESAGINHGIALIGQIAQISQTALDVIDLDKTLKIGLEGIGFPQSAIREDDDIEALRKQKAEMQAQQQQQAQMMEAQKQILNNYGKLNETQNPGSALADMNKQMTGGLAQ